MPTIIFESFHHTRHEVRADEGDTLMKAAVKNGIDGIEADCGGTCTCATCHVHIDEAFMGSLPPPRPDELEMLDFVAAERRANSRLSCQIVIDARLEGLVVRLPEMQCL